ncbi:hypothetical protein CYR55_20210 [Chimaeribacter californicus]|uniref:Uncharacterized protein n=1 Tax=Chimaeribacter californicus TaxID=2060067 RepID=A0A2N5DWN2_9GAMM|nr:hypothetical protein [Chimaeribacter californicus]PLR31656.1 hypothetical protein CYR55_20210 [Chimaeribacter californicus]
MTPPRKRFILNFLFGLVLFSLVNLTLFSHRPHPLLHALVTALFFAALVALVTGPWGEWLGQRLRKAPFLRKRGDRES